MLPSVCLSWSPQHGEKNPHGAKSFLPGHTLCLRGKRGGACGKSLKERDTSVTLRATEAWLLRRHEGKIRAGERAPLCRRSLGRKQACPEPLGTWTQQLLGHLSVMETWACQQAPTLNSRNNSLKEQAIRSRLPPGCGSLEEARG